MRLDEFAHDPELLKLARLLVRQFKADRERKKLEGLLPKGLLQLILTEDGRRYYDSRN